MKIERRTFVVGGLGAAALGAGTYAWLRERGYAVDPPVHTRPPAARGPVVPLPHAPFDPRALAVLGHVVHQLLPGDPNLALPSAEQAHVLEFIVRAAAEAGLRPVRNDILKLARTLDIVAKREHGPSYAEIDALQRQQILESIRRGEHHTKTFDPTRALEALLRLALEGYLGHPRHGGNHDAKVWAALGIDMPQDLDAGHESHKP